MDEISHWSLRIAEAAAPEEADLAPIQAEAFLRGGKDREELFAQAKGVEPGSFGLVSAQAIFPLVLNGLALAAPFIKQMFSEGPWLKDVVTTLKDLLEVRKKLDERKKTPELPEKPYAALKRTVETLSTELRSAGLPSDQRDLITYRVLLALIDSPASAVRFTDRLAGYEYQ